MGARSRAVFPDLRKPQQQVRGLTFPPGARQDASPACLNWRELKGKPATWCSNFSAGVAGIFLPNLNNKKKNEMATSRFKNSLANRGVDAEKAVQNYLELWQSKSPRREYERLIDTKAAGRVIKAASADFAFYSNDTKLSKFGLIEVKETKHTYRLSRDRITQMARLRKRANAGGICLILVLHSETALWRWMEAPVAHNWGGVASWDMSGLPTFTSPGLALADATRGVFD